MLNAIAEQHQFDSLTIVKSIKKGGDNSPCHDSLSMAYIPMSEPHLYFDLFA